MMDLDDLISGFSSLRLSALSKSIQINKFVDEVTLGPNTTIKSSPAKAPDISRKDAIDSPNTPTNHHRISRQTATLSPQQQSVLTITNRALTGLEKSRKEKEMQSIDIHLQQVELFNKQQEARRIQQWKHQQALKLQEIQQEEQLILQAMKQVETQSIIELSLARTKAEDQQKLQKLSMDCLKIEQDTATIIRDIDGLFKNNQKAKTELIKYENPFKQLVVSYKQINAKLKSEKIVEGDIQTANTVLNKAKQFKDTLKNSIKDHYQKREKEAGEKIALLKKKEEESKALHRQQKEKEEQKRLLEQHNQQQLKNQQSALGSETLSATQPGQQTSPELPSTTLEDEKLIICKYMEFQTFLQNHQQTYQQLLNDQLLKQFKSDCKKAVNFPVNGISAVNSEHLRDKYNKLHSLLSGKTVQISDTRINAAQHPQGIAFVMDLLAKKFVIQGELTVANNPDAAFAYATIIITLWNDFPVFGQLVLAHFYKSCPYLVPIVFQKQDGQSDEEFYISRGYKYEDGVIENQDKFLKRMIGISKLYFSILISHTKGGSTENPHNLANGWTWFARTLNRVPSMDITATVIYSFLEVAGSSMQEIYGKQFKKLITYVIKYQIPLLKHKDTGGPLVRLEVMLQNYCKTGIMQKPAKQLSPNFW